MRAIAVNKGKVAAKSMQADTREERGAWVVVLAGEIDLEQSPKAREILLESVGRGLPVLVDLSAVEYIDSSGVASLVEALQKARGQDTGFTLAAPRSECTSGTGARSSRQGVQDLRHPGGGIRWRLLRLLPVEF